MPWEVVAEGTNIWNLESTVGELELPKGSRIKVVMDLLYPVAPAFDVAGMEWVFQQFVPDGVIVKDVYGEGWNTAVVEMEADPAWLLPILAFIKAHWILIMIGVVTLGAIVATILVLTKIAVAPALPITAIAIGGGLALIGVLLAIGVKRR